jgi:hypothetical protein
VAVFGRKHPHPPAKHIVPPELWDDPEWATFFARIGRKPDAPENLRVTHDDVRRMIDEGRKAVLARMQQLQAKALAKGHDIRLRPFWLIQDNCWNGEVGDFLIYYLCLNPYDEWNMVILPADEKSSAILDLPIHPGGDIPAFAKIGQEIILELRDKLRAAHADVQRTHEFGHFAAICDDTVAKVKALARRFASLLAEAHKFPRTPPAL